MYIFLNLLWNLELRCSDFDPFQYLHELQIAKKKKKKTMNKVS